MKIILSMTCLLISMNISAQDKNELLKKMEQVCSEYSSSSSLVDTEFYYNIDEKILNLGTERFDLNRTKIIYSDHKPENEPIIHMLRFSSSIKNSHTSYFFKTKKSVYQIIDLIHKLKKLK